MKIGNQEFQIGKRTYVMGILNITPDSFSDGGKFNVLDLALSHARQMILEGADIIDIGGESTRPGHQVIADSEEIDRVVPVIKALKKEFKSIPISIDTYKSAVCEAAILAGANLINDVWGFKKDNQMAELAAHYHLPCCLMHNRENIPYKNLITDFMEDLNESVTIALNHGVKKENIILDPGIGFAKTYEQNLSILNALEDIKKYLPYPVLLGTSRKSTIGKALGNLPPHERLEGTLATTAIGIAKGCDFIRIHDVKENKKVCLMSDAIIRQ